MEPANCAKCGKFFMKTVRAVCNECIKDDEERFEIVRAFVKEHPNRTVREVSEECDVSVRRIIQYIREGRLEASPGIQTEITCSKCGVPIKRGRMCERCAKEIGEDVASMKKEDKPDPAKSANVYHVGKKK